MTGPTVHAQLRSEVRRFLDHELAHGGFQARSDAWMTGFDPAFSRLLGARGWVGMTLPVEYGGAGASALDRVVVVEELLAAGAPVAAHWFAERQIGPAILAHGTDAQRREWLPRIAAGDAYFAIGLSEPDSGSDLASVRCRAVRVDGGWALSGTKVWSSGAHRAHAIVVLGRTGEGSRRHDGLTQFIVRLPDPGVQINPIVSISGEHHFNEVVFDAAFVPDAMVLGEVGAAWSQVVSELAYERSGPERFLSTMALLAAMRSLANPGDARAVEDIGALVTSLSTLRAMSLDVAHSLERGEPPVVAAAMVKDLGTIFEQDSVALAGGALGTAPGHLRRGYAALLDQAQLQSPNFTLRGGTNEVLRGIVAKALLSPGWTLSTPPSLLRDTVVRMLRDTADIPGTAGLDPVWPVLVEAELPWVGTALEHGGAGGELADLVEVLGAVAGAGRSTPLSDMAFVANWVRERAGLTINRANTIALVGVDSRPTADLSGPRPTVTGHFPSLAWAGWAQEFVVVATGPDGPIALRVPAEAATLSAAGTSLAGEPCADVALDAVEACEVGTWPAVIGESGVLARAALGRAVMLCAAMDAAVQLSVRYASQREQFGRPIGQFQAVAHRLAVIAEEAAAARAAVSAALASGTLPSAAAAKARAGRAAGDVARGAHQIHGAMGVSTQYPLGRLTTRLWAWSREQGDERFWNQILGHRALAGAGLWRTVEALAEPD